MPKGGMRMLSRMKSENSPKFSVDEREFGE
jgi:hypothetical protein